MASSDDITILGRRLSLHVAGPDDARRFSVSIVDAATGRTLTRTPVRGRSAADARDRALEVAYNLLSIEYFQEQVIAVAADLAPGATVELTEHAHAIMADLTGPWTLAVSLTVPREDVTDPDGNPDDLRARIREHFRTHLQRAGG